MQILYDGLDGRQCAVIFTENGLSSVRFSNGEVRHQVPPTRLRTEQEQEEWRLTHPKDKPYLHEVLSVVATSRRNPRPVDETDNEYTAFLRARATIFVETPRKFLGQFLEQYEVATGVSLRNCYHDHPGLYIRERGGWANSLHMRYRGILPSGCPVTPNREDDGGWIIHNTRFIWTLIARDGFRLDP